MCILTRSDELSVVFSTQRTIDELLLNLTSLTIDSSASYYVGQLAARLNATRQRCHDSDDRNDGTEAFASVCRGCWLGYSDIIATSLALVWSFVGRTIQAQRSHRDNATECKQLAMLLTQHEDVMSGNEQTGLRTRNCLKKLENY